MSQQKFVKIIQVHPFKKITMKLANVVEWRSISDFFEDMVTGGRKYQYINLPSHFEQTSTIIANLSLSNSAYWFTFINQFHV